jgi:transcription initiation factor TFIID subunit TAF12
MTYNNNEMSKSSFCYLCGKPIKFDYEYINERTGKKIPLDAETNEPHNCPVRRSQREQQQSQPPQLQQQQQPSQQQEYRERRYHQCNKGCGREIYFDANNKSQSGKYIPLDKDTGPHQCQ